MTETTATLSVKGLAIPGLQPLELEIAAGECVGLSGPSGSGKSLLLRALADLDPRDGEVRLGDKTREQMAGPAWRRRVGYLATEAGWWADDVGAHFRDPDWLRASAPELGLPADCVSWPVSRLSTGEKQRLALLRLLEGAPDVLLLDEPTSALDESSTALVETLLRTHLARGAGCLLVTHDPAQGERVATRRLRIQDGAVLEVTP